MCFPSASFNHALKFISFPVDAGILLGHIRQSRGRHYAAIPIENPVGWGRILRRQAGGNPPLTHTTHVVLRYFLLVFLVGWTTFLSA
jgi:hypothetical protein